MKKLLAWALAPLCALLLASPAIAANAPIYYDASGAPQSSQGVICINPTSGAFESCAGSGGGGGGGGAVTAAANSYAAGSLSLGAIVDLGTGSSPGANTVNGRLAAINTTLGTPFQANGALGAGENHIGEVSSRTNIVGGSFTTPSGTTAYSSGQLIANSATAGSVTPLDFATVCRVNQGTGMVRRARVKTPDTGFASATVILKLYRDSPTVTNGDHGTWLSTESNYIGQISVVLDQVFSDPMEKGIGAPSVGNEINFDCASGSQHLYGLLVAGGAITPQGGKTISVVLETLVN